MRPLQLTVNSGREIAEISKDFSKPIEVVREAVHNSYDHGATEVHVAARAETYASGSRGLTLEFADNGSGMTEQQLENLFGLGHSEKVELPDRQPIGYKGHGTKIYYQAAQIFILTRTNKGELLIAHLSSAREDIHRKNLPSPTLYKGTEAIEIAAKNKLKLVGDHGTTIRLLDFTANSDRLLEAFRQAPLESYLRWFTVFGSFRKVVDPSYKPPLRLHLSGTDKDAQSEVPFGHDWPATNEVDLKVLKGKDPRRPFNYFRKSFAEPGIAISGGYRIDIAAVFEGARGRLDRDKGIRRQRSGGLYREEERYGLWLCKDFIPVEPRFDLLNDEDCPLPKDEPHLPLIFVNCQDFELTANRGSVGNSSDVLLTSIKQAVFEYLNKIREDEDLATFENEYQEDLFSRLRDKDRKALIKRIERYNKKQLCKIKLPKGNDFPFYEPTREITLFGLIAQLSEVAPDVLGLDILDFDDHVGIDLLVRRSTNPADLLDRTKVAYTELKYLLESQINHPFENLHSIICWDTALIAKDLVQDPTKEFFSYEHLTGSDGVTYSHLAPPPNHRLTNNIKVIVLKRLLTERCQMRMETNPRPVELSRTPVAATKGKK